MSAHAALRRVICSLAFAPFVLAMHGCGGPPVESSKALANRAVLDGEEDAPETPPIAAPPASDLISLAQRDVDDFLRLKRDANASASDAQADTTEPTPMAQPTPAALSQPPAIIWTDPVGKSLAAAVQPSDTLDADGADSITMGEALDPSEDREASPNDILAIEQPSLASTGTEDRLNGLLVGLSSELYMRASDADQPLRELIMISATSMVDPTRKLANIEALPGLTERERELLAAFQQFFLKLGEKLDGSEEADAAIMLALQTLQTDIVKAPTLTIPTASLCTSVEGFGKYQPFTQNRFLAHAGQQMVVYVEIDDFKCTQTPTGQWLTELSQQLIIYSDSDGIPVWREEWLPVVDTATTPRQDFYTTQLVSIPNALSVGKYHLKIRLRDEQSGAEAEQSIGFEMVADPKLAAGR